MFISKCLHSFALVSLFSLVACPSPGDSGPGPNDSDSNPDDSDPGQDDSDPGQDDSEVEAIAIKWNVMKLTIWFGYDPEIGVFNPTQGSGDDQITYSPQISALLKEVENPSWATVDEEAFDPQYLSTLDLQYLERDDQMCFGTYQLLSTPYKEWDQTGEEDGVHHYGFESYEYAFTNEGNCRLETLAGEIVEEDEAIGRAILGQVGYLENANLGPPNDDYPPSIGIGIGPQLYGDPASTIGTGILVWPLPYQTDDMYGEAAISEARGAIVGEDGVVPSDSEGNITFSTADELLDENGRPVRGLYAITTLYVLVEG